MDTVDFFQPGTTYRRGRWQFQCIAVESTPWDGVLRAVGFLFRDGTGAVHGMTADDWAHGEWIPAPECPHCAAPADASGCRIPQHDPRCPTHDPHF
jgi:hypothetical protein